MIGVYEVTLFRRYRVIITDALNKDDAIEKALERLDKNDAQELSTDVEDICEVDPDYDDDPEPAPDGSL